jgi:diphosphomevalonate decarboxylase
MTQGVKVTVSAPANIALVKYWGARDLARALPLNPSISMTLSACRSTTTVEVLPGGALDEVLLAAPDGRLRPAPAAFGARVVRHLDEIRAWAGRGRPAAGSSRSAGARSGPPTSPAMPASADSGSAAALAPVVAFRVATANSFPAAAGLASSASGFAALAVAAAAALGRSPSPADLSRLARRSGSGSAARSVLGGYVEWPAPATGESGGGADPDDPAAAVLAPAAHWDLRDLVVLVETGPKEVSSLDGHRRAPTSPHFPARLAELPRRLAEVRRALAERDFARLAPVVEEEAIELHLVAMSSRPPVFYWRPATLAVLAAVRALAAERVPACATLDAGANVHVLTTPEAEPVVAARLAAIPGVQGILHDRVGEGPRFHDEHLF